MWLGVGLKEELEFCLGSPEADSGTLLSGFVIPQVVVTVREHKLPDMWCFCPSLKNIPVGQGKSFQELSDPVNPALRRIWTSRSHSESEASLGYVARSWFFFF